MSRLSTNMQFVAGNASYCQHCKVARDALVGNAQVQYVDCGNQRNALDKAVCTHTKNGIPAFVLCGKSPQGGLVCAPLLDPSTGQQVLGARGNSAAAYLEPFVRQRHNAIL